MALLDKLRQNSREMEKAADAVKEKQREYARSSDALTKAQLEFTKTIERRLDLEKELERERG